MIGQVSIVLLSFTDSPFGILDRRLQAGEVKDTVLIDRGSKSFVFIECFISLYDVSG
jgi:hypothetical protein